MGRPLAGWRAACCYLHTSLQPAAVDGSSCLRGRLPPARGHAASPHLLQNRDAFAGEPTPRAAYRLLPFLSTSISFSRRTPPPGPSHAFGSGTGGQQTAVGARGSAHAAALAYAYATHAALPLKGHEKRHSYYISFATHLAFFFFYCTLCLLVRVKYIASYLTLYIYVYMVDTV